MLLALVSFSLALRSSAFGNVLVSDYFSHHIGKASCCTTAAYPYLPTMLRVKGKVIMPPCPHL